MKGKRRGRRGASVVLAAAVLTGVGEAWAGISFDSTSRVTLTHDADLSNAADTPQITGPIAVPRSSSIYPVNPYQLENTFTLGASSSTAAGSLGQVTNSTTGTFALATGTGVAQSDPDEVYPGASSLKFDVNMIWNVTTGGFGPLANGFATLTAGGDVGAGGSAELHINLTFLSGTGAALRTPWIVDQVWGPGPFTQPFTTSRVLGAGSLASGTKMKIVGTIEFRASNAESPTKLTGLRNEFGGAPPTGIFKPNAEGSWFDRDNWELVDPDEPGLLVIANGMGDRALFYGTTGGVTGRSVGLSSPITLGTLDVDGNASYHFTNGSAGKITFATEQGNGVINVRGTQVSDSIQVPVQLIDSVEVITEGTSTLHMSDAVSGTGGIVKSGTGKLILSGNNTYSGPTTVAAGMLHIIGATGAGAVTVANGATLGGDGLVGGNVTVQSGGHIAPGKVDVGTIAVRGLTLNGGARLDMEGNASGFDRINLTATNTLNLAGINTINLIDLGGVAPGDYVILDYAGTAMSTLDHLSLSGGIAGLGASLFDDTANTDVVLRIGGFVPPSQWNVDASGSWGVGGNWSPNIVPDGQDAVANFLGAITTPRTVTLDGNRILQFLNFDNANKYTIAAGTGGTLTIGDATHPGTVDVEAGGSHEISAPVVLGGNTILSIKGGLTMSGGLSIAASKSAVKDGSGTLTIAGPQTPGTGSSLVVTRGRVNLNSNAGAGGSVATLALSVIGNVSIAAANVVLGADQDLKGLSVGFAAGGTQTFDLNSGSGAGAFRSVRVYAADLEAAKASLYSAIVNANSAGAVDAMDGIIDTGLHANSGIGIAKMSDHVFIRPTRIGDLNLDGAVTISDFIDLASNFNTMGTATWQEGDLNYDRNVTIADFIDLASNFNSSYSGQTWAISERDASILAAFADAHGVPEPGMGVLMLGMGMLLGRRRMRFG